MAVPSRDSGIIPANTTQYLPAGTVESTAEFGWSNGGNTFTFTQGDTDLLLEVGDYIINTTSNSIYKVKKVFALGGEGGVISGEIYGTFLEDASDVTNFRIVKKHELIYTTINFVISGGARIDKVIRSAGTLNFSQNDNRTDVGKNLLEPIAVQVTADSSVVYDAFKYQS